MTHRDAELREIRLGQARQDVEVDVVRLEAIAVLREAEGVEPLAECGAHVRGSASCRLAKARRPLVKRGPAEALWRGGARMGACFYRDWT